MEELVQEKEGPKGCKNGTLILAANSIGNPLDIPHRSITAIQTADLLVFEEDRPARQCLKAAGVHRDYFRLSEHHETETLHAVTDCLKCGKTVCYMSDQGMPSVADPGFELVQIAYRLKSKILVIPGPCSITAAIAACPFMRTGYNFIGFLPREKPLRQKALQNLMSQNGPYVILDTPYRLHALLESCSLVFGGNHRAMLALDVSGSNEEYLVGSLANILERALALTDKLNFVLVIDAKKPLLNPEKEQRKNPSRHDCRQRR